MQQHTAQHLVSAVAAAEMGAATTSWDLLSGVVNVELSNVPDVTVLEQRFV